MRYLKGDKIFDGKSFLPATAVLVYDHQNMLRDVISTAATDSGSIEHYEGILCPGFVNAHCHLELSHLKGLIPEGTGLPLFARQIMSLRNQTDLPARQEAMAAADAEMQSAGIVAVGDICNTDESLVIKQNSDIFYHSFVELIALSPLNAGKVFSQGLQLYGRYREAGLEASLAPHAPYSASPELIASISEFDSLHDLPFTIHNQESEAEDEFFRSGTGPFRELYSFLNLDISFFRATGKSSLQSYAGLLPGTGALLVHNTFSDPLEAQNLVSGGLRWCFCPSANLYIEQQLPDFEGIIAGQNNFCLGTDSLASNDSLNLIKEANLLSQKWPGCPEVTLLAALTSVPAAALHVSQRFGSLKPGLRSGLNQIEMQNGKLKFIKRIL